MAKAKEYRCIKGWARNQIGDIVEAYEFFRYPQEIRQRHFVEVAESIKKAPKPIPAVTKTAGSIEEFKSQLDDAHKHGVKPATVKKDDK